MEKPCVTFLLCDPGWCVHKSNVQNKWDRNTHTNTKPNVLYQKYYHDHFGRGVMIGGQVSRSTAIMCGQHLQHSTDQPCKVANSSPRQLNRENIFPCPRSRLRFCSREKVWPSRPASARSFKYEYNIRSAKQVKYWYLYLLRGGCARDA